MDAFTRVQRWLAVALLCCLVPFAARADDDPPGRVGRISALQGSVSFYDAEQGQWVPAPLNRPLTQGDRLSTDPDGRAQLDVGSTTLRLDGNSELEVLRLDDTRLRFQLHSGGMALRVRAREVADETEIVTAEARLHPLRSGHYRIERLDDSTYVTAWRGEMRVEDAEQPFTVDGGRRAEVWREGSGRLLRLSWTAVPDDDFTRWAQAEEQRPQRSVAQSYVSPEMTGAQDLDRYGRWEQHPDYGAVWIPSVVVADWAPYRYGHWAWVAPWGWTWVDDAPWGFAPFHYGRWVSWGGRWCWTPGAYVARPVYAPALVAWVGGPGFSVSVQVGTPALPAVAWVPLAPREVFVPYYRATPVYAGRVNPYPPGRRPPPQVPTGPVMYGNQAVPGAVTVVPRDVFVRREPVARAAVNAPEVMRRPQPVLRTPPVALPAPVVTPLAPGVPQRDAAPHARPPRLQPVPGGAQPAAPRGAAPVPAPAQAPAVVDMRPPRPEVASPRPRAPERDDPARQAQERQALERAQQDRAQQDRVQQERQAREQAARETARQARERQSQEAVRQAQEQQQQQARERQLQEQQRQAHERQAQEAARQAQAQEQQRQAREHQAQEAARQAQERARQEAAPVAPRATPAPAAPRAPEREDARQKQPVKPGERDVR